MTAANRNYDEFAKSVRRGDDYWRTFTALQFVIAIRRIMQQERVTQRELAARINGMGPSTLSRHLNGTENTGIETMLRIAGALDSAVHIHVAKRGVPVRFVEGQPVDALGVDATTASATTEQRTAADFVYRAAADQISYFATGVSGQGG